jgi:stalled ribosome rescue protein Dom34
MSLFHAVVLIDHTQAQVLQFDAEHVQSSRIKTHQHYTKQHGSEVRSEHEFFGHVCDALEGIAEVLVTGTKTALADFRHYAEKHRAATAQRIVGYEIVDHPSQHQLVALARQYFLRHDRMAGEDVSPQAR